MVTLINSRTKWQTASLFPWTGTSSEIFLVRLKHGPVSLNSNVNLIVKLSLLPKTLCITFSTKRLKKKYK